MKTLKELQDERIKELQDTVEWYAKELEQRGFQDFLENEEVFDIEVRADMRTAEYRSACVTLGLNGPTVWLDTDDGMVHAWHGFDKYEYPVSYEVIEEVDQYVESCWPER